MQVVLSVTVTLVDLSVAIMHVTVSVAVIRLEVSAALMQMTVSVAIMQAVLPTVHNCFYCKMQVTVSVIGIILCTPFSAGGGLNLVPNFQKGGGLTGPQL